MQERWQQIKYGGREQEQERLFSYYAEVQKYFNKQGWECSSVAQCFSTMHKALGSTPSTPLKRKKGKKTDYNNQERTVEYCGSEHGQCSVLLAY